MVVRNIAAALAGSVLVLLVGCATTHGNLTSSADRLERNADLLARDARDDSSGTYSRDAHRLADEAHEFRRTVHDRGADSSSVKSAFEDLSKDYHALRDEVDRADSRQAQLDLKPVTEAYLDVEREMGGYPDRDRVARDHDTYAR